MYASNLNRRGHGGFGFASASRGRTPRSYVWSWKTIRDSDRNRGPDMGKFVNQHALLIERERNNVLNKMVQLSSTMSAIDLEASGYAMVGLRVAEQRSSDHGSTEVRLEAASKDMVLPPTVMRIGEIVCVDAATNDAAIHTFDLDSVGPVMGTISSLGSTELTICLNPGQRIPQHWNGRCSISKLIFDVFFKRILIALRNLASYPHTRPSLHQVVYSGYKPKFYSQALLDSDYVDALLNRSQKDAVQLAITANAIALIHGLPGTGKTRVLVEVICQLLHRKQRVLVCGPSNVSVDNITNLLAAIPDISMVRTGNSGRISSRVMPYSLDSLKANFTCDVDPTSPEDPLVAELTHMLSGVMLSGGSIEAMSNLAIIRSKHVVLSTLNNTGSRDMRGDCGDFDVVVIDGSTKAFEGECWIAALKAPKLILTGDSNQLYPMFKNVDGRIAITNSGLGSPSPKMTMFERVRYKHGDKVTRTLLTQYRMHADIMKVSAEALYAGKMVADTSVAAHVLRDLEHVEANNCTRAPLVLIDTTGREMAESLYGHVVFQDHNGMVSSGSESWINTGEAQLAMDHVEMLVAAGVDVKDIAVMSLYDAQVAHLKVLGEARYPELDIGSIDAFQGREKEAVVLSMVRSNPSKEVGFLRDVRRMNVAITRAKRHLCVIADSSTVSEGDPFLKALFTHLKDKAHVIQPSA